MAKPAPKPKLLTLLAVAVGGGLGALARVYLPWPASWGADSLSNPLPMLVVNLLGAVLLGFLSGYIVNRAWPEALQQGITVGFLGAFTTMSALAFSVSVIPLPQPAVDTTAWPQILGVALLSVVMLIGFVLLTTVLTVASYRTGIRLAGA